MFRERKKSLVWIPKKTPEPGRADSGNLIIPYILSLVSAFFFAQSGVHMLTEEFPDLAAYSGGKLPMGGFLAILAVMVTAFELPGRRFPLCRKLLTGFIPLAGLFSAWSIAAKQGKELLSGGLWAAGSVIAAMNRHYKFNFALPEGEEEYGALAVAALCGIFLLILAYLASLCRKRWILIGFPALILVLGLTAGYAPGLKGITEGFIGLLFCQAGGWNGAKEARAKAGKRSENGKIWLGYGLSLFLLLLLAALIPLGISGIFSGKAQKAAESGDGVITLQRKMEGILEEKIQQMSFSSGNSEKENINNRTPKYREQEVLHVTVKNEPEHTLYLRGFYGGEYARGGWNSNPSVFRESLAGQNLTETEAARWLSGRTGTFSETPDMGLDEELSAALTSAKAQECTLQFARSADTVYVPYFLLPEEADTALTYSGEYQISKKKNLDTVRFMGSEAAGYTAFSEQQDGKLEDWYSSYVEENYMGGSEAVPSASLIAEELLDQYSGSYSRVRAEMISEELLDGDTAVRNQARLQFARIVSAYLSSGAYSLSLQRVPDGTDVVEYFLAESKTGYCVHYASAGVLILQSMGIPARYASGYVVKPRDFENSGGSYGVSVKDSAAHAWAEIYLDGIGWVPVEMTPGYEEESEEAVDEEMMTLLTDPVLEQPEEAPENQELSETSALPDISELPVSQNVPEQPDTLDEDSSGKLTEDGQGEKEDGLSGVLHLALAAAGGLGILALALYLIFIRKRRKIQLLRREIRQKRNRQAILRMNRSLYRRVKGKGGGWFSALTDDAYKQRLIQIFPEIPREEWEQFICIAQKASFSKQEITAEEVQGVYRLYKGICR